jgi:non-homologous end joining protein Ku
MAYRASANNVKVSITGTLLSTVGSIIPIKDTEDQRDTKLSMICPACRDSKLDQFYRCKKGCLPEDPDAPGWTTKEIPDRGREVDGKIVAIDPDQLEEAQASLLEKGVLALDVRPAESVTLNTWPGGTAYWFEPDRADPFYGFLVELACNPEVALIGLMNLRGGDKLYRLCPWGGGLVLQEVLRPQDVRTFQVHQVNLGDAEKAMGDALVKALMADFNPDDYASEKVAAYRQLIADAAAAENPNGAAPASVAKKSKKAAEPDLTSMLAAALAVATARKSA